MNNKINLAQRRFKLAYQYARTKIERFSSTAVKNLHDQGALKYLGHALLSYRAQGMKNSLYFCIDYPLLDDFEMFKWAHRNKLQRIRDMPRIKLP